MGTDQMVPWNKKKNIEAEDDGNQKVRTLCPVFAEEEKKDKNSKGGENGRPKKNKAIIIEQLVCLVSDDLEEPEIINPFPRGLYKGEIAVLRDRPVLKDIPPAVQMVPQVGIGPGDRPLEEVVKDKKKEQPGICGIGIIWLIHHHRSQRS